jgi:hypothetical protein
MKSLYLGLSSTNALLAACAAVIFLLSGSGSATLQAQATNTPRGFIDKGLKVTGLTGDGAAPFHIKANYSLYDHGNLVESGVFEEWATGPWTWHRVYTEKKLTASEWSITHADHVQTKDPKLDFAKLDSRVAIPLTNPMYQAVNYTSGVDLDGKAGTFNGLILDCVSVTDAASHAGKVNPDLLFPMYCFDVKDSTLRFTKTQYTLVSYTDFKPLGDRSVATKMDVNFGGKTFTTAEITTLEPLSAADQAQVAPSGKTVPQPYMHQATDAPLVPVRLTECAYPMSARNAQERATIYLPVVIRKDGSVKNGNGYGGPQDLVEAAQDCVGNWKYEPFKIDGQPADVSETLIITFNDGPFKGEPGYASQPPATPAAPAK